MTAITFAPTTKLFDVFVERPRDGKPELRWRVDILRDADGRAQGWTLVNTGGLDTTAYSFLDAGASFDLSFVKEFADTADRPWVILPSKSVEKQEGLVRALTRYLLERWETADFHDGEGFTPDIDRLLFGGDIRLEGEGVPMRGFFDNFERLEAYEADRVWARLGPTARHLIDFPEQFADPAVTIAAIYSETKERYG